MNNKGFAITTVLYGTFLLFMMLLLSMLGILSTYKDKMEILIDNTNGARDIINVYDEGSWLMSLGSGTNVRNYYKAHDGTAIIGYVNNGAHIGPLLVSTDREAVHYYTDYTENPWPDNFRVTCPDLTKDGKHICIEAGNFNYNGTIYYYSSGELWMGNREVNNNLYGWTGYNMSLEEAARKILEDNVK